MYMYICSTTCSIMIVLVSNVDKCQSPHPVQVQFTILHVPYTLAGNIGEAFWQLAG